jgi:hypothetical protein
MRLSAQHRQDLYDAIINAFADRNELERTLGLRLNVNLDLISPTPSLPDAAFESIQWAEREGRVEELIAALSAAKPRNTSLSELARQLANNSVAPGAQPQTPDQEPNHGSIPPAPAVDLNDLPPELRRQLYNALLAAFPTPGGLALVLKLHLDTTLAEITSANGLNNQTLDVITWVCAQGQLERFIRGALTENPGNPALQRFARAVGILPAANP